MGSSCRPADMLGIVRSTGRIFLVPDTVPGRQSLH